MALITATQLSSLEAGLVSELGTIASALENKLLNTTLPLFGTNVEGAIQQGEAALAKFQALQNELSNALGALQDGLDHPLSDVASALNAALAQAGFANVASVSLNSSDALTVTVSSSQTANFDQALASDLGLGAFGLATTGTAEINLGYHVNLSATVDTAGNFSLSTPGGGPAASLTLDASAPNFSADTNLGDLNFTTQDAGSSLTSSFAIGADGSVSANAAAQVDLHLGADLQNADFPSISADVSANWTLGSAPKVSFDNVQIDFGSFVTHFIDPVLNRLDPFLQPLHQLAAILNSNIVPLDNFAGLLGGSNGQVTLIDLMQKAEPGINLSSLTTAANFVTEFTDWVAFLQNRSFGPDKYNLGSFTIDPSLLSAAPKITATAQNLGAFLDNLSSSYGAVDSGTEQTASQDLSQIISNSYFSFPILTDPTQALDILLGKDASLFTFDVTASAGVGAIAPDGTPTSTVQIGPTIPLLAFPPLGLTLDGAVQASANIAGGYDTYGLQQYAASGYQDLGDLANGFYLAASAGAPLLSLAASIGANADLNGLLANLMGGVNVTADLSVLVNNTVHLDQFASDIAQALTVAGQINAGFDAQIVTLGGWTPWSYSSQRVILADFTSGAPGLSGPSSDSCNASSTGSGPQTTFNVATTADFVNALSSINAGGADDAANTAYRIVIGQNDTVAIDANFPGINLSSGSVLQIVDNGTLKLTGPGGAIGAPISGSGGVEVSDGGTYTLSSANSFAGGVNLVSGSLELGSSGAAGGGAVVFAYGAAATLIVDQGSAPTGEIDGFDSTDVIDLVGLNLTSATRDPTNLATITGADDVVAYLQFDPAQDLTGLATKPDGNGGTDVVLLQTHFTVASSADFDAAITSINIGGANALADTPFTIGVASGATVGVDNNFPGLNLPSGATLKIADGGELDFSQSAALTFAPFISGSGSVKIIGPGVTTLAQANTYAGGTTLDGATLDLGDPAGAGTGAIAFASGVKSTLKVESGDVPANTLTGLASGDHIDLAGLAVSAATIGANNLVTAADANNQTLAQLQLDPKQNLDGYVIAVKDDGVGGSDLRLIQTVFDVATTQQFDTAVASIEVGGDNSAPGIDYKITLDPGADIRFDGAFSALDLSPGDTLRVIDNGTLGLAIDSTVTFGADLSGAGSIEVGAGKLSLTGADSFLGGATLEGGTLDLPAAGAAGAGPIVFAVGSHATLLLETGATLANAVSGFLPGETLDLAGVTATAAQLGAQNVLTVLAASGVAAIFNLNSAVDYSDYAFKTKSDGGDGSVVDLPPERPSIIMRAQGLLS